MKETTIHHPIYGEIHIKTNPRARRIILRARGGIIEVTMPTTATRKHLDDALAQYGGKMLALCQNNTPGLIDGSYSAQYERFSFALQPTDKNSFYISYKGTTATLLYPQATDFNNEDIQEWLRRVRITALRNIAQRELPPRLKELAAKHGFSYNTVSLRDSHSRWGSCNTRGNISLSIYLQLLPAHLADYVMLHELCHTVEMNHSERFWALMDKVTDSRAKMLRAELKGHKTDF